VSAKVLGISKPQRKSRYRPTMCNDNEMELISAADHRRMDAEQLCERLSERFIGQIRLMDDDQLIVLEILAQGIDNFHDFLPDLFNEGTDPGRVITAARRFAKRRKRGAK
jgi:hypothetical protein